MSESRSQIPDFTLETEIDMSSAAQLRRELGAASPPAPSFNDLLVRAVGLCLRELPALNASYVDGAVTRFSRVNVGIAVATDDALLVPTIFDADAKSVAEIAAESRRPRAITGSYGAEAARFLQRLRDLLEHPSPLQP